MLVVNDPRFAQRAEIIWEKGTNRSAFFRGEVDKYGWVDIGSSFLPSEIIAAFLWSQLEHLEDIQNKRKSIWQQYWEGLLPLQDADLLKLPHIPDYATNNAHMFYLVCNNLNERSDLIEHLKTNGFMAVFHYLSLHKSEYYAEKHDGRQLKNCDRYADTLLRLPFYFELSNIQVVAISNCILDFYSKR